MCGICGLIGKGIDYDEMEAFQDLFLVSTLRGRDSYGLFTYTPTGVFKDNKYRIEKDNIPASDFISREFGKKREERMIRSIFTEAYLGHARYATVGKKSALNAHPFDTGRYIGTHNGTLTDSRFRSDPNKTDSELMFKEMEEKGIDDVLSSLSSTSAYAVSIFDKKSKKIFLSRNDKRPLYVGIADTTGSVFYASELEMLRLVAERKRESGYRVGMKYFFLEPHHLYEIDINKTRPGNLQPWVVTDWVDVIEERKKKSEKEFRSFDQNLFDKYSITSNQSSLWEYEACSSCGELLDDFALSKAQTWNVGSEKFVMCNECVKSTRTHEKTVVGM